MDLQSIAKIKGHHMLAGSGVIKMREEIVAAVSLYPDEAVPLLDAADAAYRALEEIHRRLTDLASNVAYRSDTTGGR